jgi:hypothetical protein
MISILILNDILSCNFPDQGLGASGSCRTAQRAEKNSQNWKSAGGTTNHSQTRLDIELAHELVERER